MQKKAITWKTKGMNRDLSVSAFNPEFSFENRNLRLSTNEGNTLMSWVNEKGTKNISLLAEEDTHYDEKHGANVSQLVGTPIGTAVINHQLILFTHDINDTTSPDYIYTLKLADASEAENDTTMVGIQLYNGNLKFSIDNPIETLVSYESELIQKVYWVDGKNQPRVINIANLDSDTLSSYIDTSFDFVSTLQLKELVSVKKNIGSEGMFAPGVIQYACTYVNKNGQESNIFYVTPLYYISYIDRGGSPEDKISNSFTIEISNADMHFDYLRIYSIQRTSINGTPICKRVQDISLSSFPKDDDTNIATSVIKYTDTGTNGDSVDPTELLYLGGEKITAATLEQKDGTLFLGNLSIERDLLDIDLKSKVTITSDTRKINCVNNNFSNFYSYYNQLSSTQVQNGITTLVPCGGFKARDTYRLGVQFQYETGKWSDPIYLSDEQELNSPEASSQNIILPIFKAVIDEGTTDAIKVKLYKKVRPVVVFPSISDRTTVCQGIANPTLYTELQRNTDNICYAQSSWFFRPLTHISGSAWGEEEAYYYSQNKNSIWTPPYNAEGGYLPSVYGVNPDGYETPGYLRTVETNGYWNPEKRFRVDRQICTLHSPDIEFDDAIHSIDFTGMNYAEVGLEYVGYTISDIDLQVSGPAKGSGFKHRSNISNTNRGINAGLFYGDWLIDDDVLNSGTYGAYPYQTDEMGFFVYPWQRSGSINNDINREGQTAILKKKVISNLRYFNFSKWHDENTAIERETSIQLFSSDELEIIKVDGKIYEGNYQNYFTDDFLDGVYFSAGKFEGHDIFDGWGFDSINYGKMRDYTQLLKPYASIHCIDSDPNSPNSTWSYNGAIERSQIGDTNNNLIMQRGGTHIEYKSTPHIVFIRNSDKESWTEKDNECTNQLPIVEIRREIDPELIYGGDSLDALKANTWIPCGEPVILGCDGRTGGETGTGSTVIYFDYGDTYFQRYDCLKTYPFSSESENQIVEIGSFMLETRQNIDGRYDRNRGQVNNLNMYPGKNFNLMNPVYNQINNFFSYKIQDEDDYKNTYFPNYITWSKTKEDGAINDLWTNITMSSVLALDGDKGEVTSLQRLNDKIICFQDTGVSQILYNENVQISSTEGVPIEIANSGKVQGKRYLSNTIGCSNKWSIVKTPMGIYFMDSNEKSIYRLGDGLQSISLQGGFSSWCKQNIPSAEITWNPTFSTLDSNNNSSFVGYYDSKNQDILYINDSTALAFSEKLNAFTSFYDYGGTPFFCTLYDTGIWVTSNTTQTTLWKHQAGNYCSFFGTTKPYSMTLIGNPEPQLDKMFINLDFRATVSGDGEYNTSTDKLTPTLPFDYLEAWNEHQHGITTLSNKNGSSAMRHFEGNDSSLKRKFRMWRCDIPRDSADVDATTENPMGIYRFKKHPMDRMRNPWLYLKLKKNVGSTVTPYSLPFDSNSNSFICLAGGMFITAQGTYTEDGTFKYGDSVIKDESSLNSNIVLTMHFKGLYDNTLSEECITIQGLPHTFTESEITQFMNIAGDSYYGGYVAFKIVQGTLYGNLIREETTYSGTFNKAEIHDVSMIYYE